MWASIELSSQCLFHSTTMKLKARMNNQASSTCSRTNINNLTIIKLQEKGEDHLLIIKLPSIHDRSYCFFICSEITCIVLRQDDVDCLVVME